jgi:hypothetical protein
MSDPNNRKERERFLLERFLTLSNIKADIVGNGESPDFELILDSRTVGVEITEIFAPTHPGQLQPQAQESLRSRIVDAARREYENSGGRNIHVSVVFYTGMDFRKIRRDSVANSLVALIRTLPLTDGRHTSWHNTFDTSPELDVVAYVSVLPVSAPTMAHWSEGEAGWVSPLTIDLFESRITEKNNLIQSYRKRFSEVWLIVATTGDRPSQFFNLDEPPDFSAIHSEFDQTYFLSSILGRVLSIGGKVEAPNP